MDFTDAMRTRRAAAGWSQQQLADRLAETTGETWSRSTVTKLESGAREPKLAEALAISGLLTFSLDALRGGADQSNVTLTVDTESAATQEMMRKIVLEVLREQAGGRLAELEGEGEGDG